MFIDLYLTQVALIYPSEMDKIYTLDLGMLENDEEIEGSEGQKEFTEIAHDFKPIDESIFPSLQCVQLLA